MKKLSLAFVLCLLASLVAAVPDVQAAEPEAITVELGLDKIRDLVYVPDVDRIVVSGDDEILIYTREGLRTGRITGIAGAGPLAVDGPNVAVLATTSRELVVIDVAAAQIERRVQTGAERVASLAVVGDSAFFGEYSPTSSSAIHTISKISLSTGVLTPGVFKYLSYIDHIVISPGLPDVFFLNGHSVERRTVDGPSVSDPNHSEMFPIVVDDAGEFVYGDVFVGENGKTSLLQIDADTLERTGLRFESPVLSTQRRPDTPNSLELFGDDLARSYGSSVALYETGSPDLKNLVHFRTYVVAFDLTADQVFAAHGGADTSLNYTSASSQLTIADHGYQPGPVVLDVWVEAYGDVDDGFRPYVRWTCSDGTHDTEYLSFGHKVSISLTEATYGCDLWVRISPNARTAYTYPGGERHHSEAKLYVVLTGDRTADTRSVVQEYDSVYNSIGTFIDQQYEDLLDRSPTLEERHDVVRRLNDGSITPARFVTDLVAGQDFLGTVAPISRLYLSYFGRWPDEPGLNFWLSRSRDGMSLDWASNYFASSSEFDARYGQLDDHAFIRLVYNNVLSRDPDAAGYDYWKGQLTTGLSRGELMTGFSESPENINRVQTDIIVRSLYHGLLEREPDAEGFAFWTAHHRAGHSLEALVISFLDSVEYSRRFWHIDPVAALGAEMNEADEAESSALSASDVPPEGLTEMHLADENSSR